MYCGLACSTHGVTAILPRQQSLPALTGDQVPPLPVSFSSAAEKALAERIGNSCFYGQDVSTSLGMLDKPHRKPESMIMILVRSRWEALQLRVRQLLRRTSNTMLL